MGPSHAAPGGARRVFVESLRLGLTSFGGPIAHLGYQRRAFVDRLGWVDDATFAALVALCQSLPGPASSQLSIAIGRMHAGIPGALAAFLGFTLPSAIVMTVVGLAVGTAGPPDAGPVAGAIAGLKAAAVAVVAHAVVTMGRRLAPDAPRLVIAAAAALLVLAWPVAPAQLAAIGGAGAVGWLLWGRDRVPAADDDRSAGTDHGISLHVGGRRTSVVFGVAFAALLVVTLATPVLTDAPGPRFVAAIARAGALVFGGGHVVLPLLDAGVVAPGWVGPDAFVAGYGFAQAVPGPLFTFAAYLGTISNAGPGGVAGAAIATAAIFLPGALLVLAALPALGGAARRPWLDAALRGVNAAVVGILAAALVTPVGTSGITSPASAVVAITGALVLLRARVSPLAVVAAAALIMAALASLGIR